MAKELKLFNGRGYCLHQNKLPEQFKGKRTPPRICAAAYSMADLNRLINEFNGYEQNHYNEIKNYFSTCWGNSMEGITPERGLWLENDSFHDDNKPVRVL